MRIGLLAYNCGDGEVSIHFFKNIDSAIECLEDDEDYFFNDEVTEIEVPDNFTPPGFWQDA